MTKNFREIFETRNWNFAKQTEQIWFKIKKCLKDRIRIVDQGAEKILTNGGKALT